MTEPTIQRGVLFFWLILSVGVAMAMVALGMGLEPAGAPILRAPLGSPAAGALGFGLLMIWAAYAYGLTAGRAAGRGDYALAGLNLGLPLLLMLLWLNGLNGLAFFVALGWSISLIGMGLRLFQREALAALMLLPILGVSLTGILLSLTLWVLPPAETGGF